MSRRKWFAFEPRLGRQESKQVLSEFGRKLARLAELDVERERNTAIESCRRRTVAAIDGETKDRQSIVSAIHLLADLAKQRWTVQVRRSGIRVSRPESDRVGDDARQRIRTQLHAERDEQLRQQSVQTFIRSMETRRLFQGRFVSIFSLMRDGRELTTALQERDYTKVIEPYLEFVTEGAVCRWTGLSLVDVWRYFRHTWANPYKSVPGRTMMILVRDAAAPCHPVLGIAALSSAAVAVSVRDDWIGWTPESVIAEIRQHPSARLAAWLQRTVDESIDELYLVDLVEDEQLGVNELRNPSAETVRRLSDLAKEERRKHYRFMQSGDYKKANRASELSEEHWPEQARMSLFKSKRALELAQLLSVRMVLREFFGPRPGRDGLLRLVKDGRGRDAIARIVRRAKAMRVGTVMADISVCGALPPYNELLGGKLVAALMATPEVVAEYRRRYSKTPSVIASSMAGRPVFRPAHLALLGTTSLYGQRPSQYDRIVIPWTNGGQVNAAVGYHYLGRTAGLGTFQFGEQTVHELSRLLSQSRRGQQVNSVFGEGVNPRLRKIRDGLNELGLHSDELLNHGARRLVYAMPLVTNVREYLLGIDAQPKYVLPQRNPTAVTRYIVRWWLERWVVKRVKREDALVRMGMHTLVHPIRHGARVVLPRTDVDQAVLFEEGDP